ncbi:MAG: hypothetical protein OSJ45_07285 [Lachnospiraceae bacterium]|nr:hypothetical protein [Lachnospiraceae bacterium]
MLTPHITEEQLRNYISGNMAQKEQVNFYRHIAGCTCCAGKLASAMQEEEIIYTPPGLREDILGQTVYNKRSIARNIKLFSFKSKKKQNEFLMYTAKVSFAVSLAVLMIMTTALPGSRTPGSSGRVISFTKEITEKDKRNNSKILDLFRSTSDKISDDVSRVLNLD